LLSAITQKVIESQGVLASVASVLNDHRTLLSAHRTANAADVPCDAHDVLWQKKAAAAAEPMAGFTKKIIKRGICTPVW